jgi:hypothetical protein
MNPRAPVPNVTVSESGETFTVAQRTFRMITHLQRIEASTTQAADETVEWWELRDALDHVMYRQSYPVAFQNGMFESTVAISARSFTTEQGSGILVEGIDLPSAPGSGGWVQVFGFRYGRDKYGADESLFGPFGPPIYVEGEFLDVDSDRAGSKPLATGGPTVMVMHDILRFKVWTGNFHIIYPVLINWITGNLQPAERCLETTSKGPIERCSYPVQVEAHRENQPTFVRLFPEPDENFTPKHVIVQPASRIEYIEARTPMAWSEDPKAISFTVNGDVWLKIRIDGHDGWIHSDEDFEAIGLPPAG